MNKLLLIILVFFQIPNLSAKVYDVKKFGAKGDGKTDDLSAFNQCISKAIEDKEAKILIPYGTYVISATINIGYLDQHIEIIGLKSTKNKNPSIRIRNYQSILHISGFLFNESKGSIKMSNIDLIGNNQAYGKKHPLINKDIWLAGLLITDKRYVYIKNVNVMNVYGQGIHISTTKQQDIDLKARFENVDISDCKILNVWGYNPKKDSYGDAIYISNVANGNIKNNTIRNNLNVTKQLGRCGIVLEYMAENILLKNNIVQEGYDRAIHIENTFGGHKILNNKFYGSDLSLVLFEPLISQTFREILFEGNYFSNINMPKGKVFNKVYNRFAYGDRALFFLLTSGESTWKKIIFNKNNLTIDLDYVYDSNSILNNRAKAAFFLANTYSIVNNDKSIEMSIYNYSNSSMSENKIIGNIKLK